MIQSENRPKGMSQLDWLWVNYSPYNVSNEPSEIPSERIILTEQAIDNLISKTTSGGITSLTFGDDPDDETQVRLIGTSSTGEELTVVKMPKEDHIVLFESRKVTQTEVDNGCPYTLGTDVLAITTKLGNTYMVNVADIAFPISGTETDTVYTEVNNWVVASTVKIDDNNNANSAVEIKSTNKGLYANLKIDNTATGVTLETSENGLKASIPINGENSLAFSQMTLNEYLASEVVEGMVYFITDYPYIYLDNVRYGINISPGDNPIISLEYDSENMILTYKKSDGSDAQTIVLGPASAEQNGMMTTEQYTDLQRLLTALGDITDIPEYVTSVVRNAAFSLEWGETSGKKKPLLLKDGNGNVLSTVETDVEDYLNFAEQRAATAEDVEKAAAQGVTIKEGDAILVLTLVSGDVVYVALSQLVDIYNGEKTNTVLITVKDYAIYADVILPEDEKILYESVNGLAAKISVKQNVNDVIIYGKTEEEDNVLGSFKVSDQLLSYTVFENITSMDENIYPPAQVDGVDYDHRTNPVTLGEAYLVLTMGIDTGDTSTSSSYNLYLSITKLIDNYKVSEDEDNLLTKGSDGHLYVAIPWENLD